YNTDIYSEERIDRMAGHIKTLISSVLENPETKVKDFEIIPEEEKNLLLNVFNDTDIEYSEDGTILGLFEEQVRRTPDNIAVVFGDYELTYRELNGKANIVGHYLVGNAGIKPGDFVGLFMDRSWKMVIALLGILKSGAAYIPIDRDYPQSRIDYILNDSGLKTVIGDATDGVFIDIDEILSGNPDTSDPDIAAASRSPLYVIYTSGTTGNPKGTIIDNGNYLNYISWAKDYYFRDSDAGNFGLFSSISFDLTSTSIFLPLLRGMCLKVFAPQQEINEILLEVFTGGLIDCVKLTPSHISILASLDICGTNIKLAIAGGEELQREHVRILRSMDNGLRIVNEYGPTETTVGSVAREIGDPDEKILIGSPIANTKIHMMTGDVLSPVGVPGELCITGRGVTGGYFDRPGLTSERFVGNPFIPGGRMYRTGDLARWLPDGNIEFLGRIDNQVKLRGFRIEPGEIENVLLNKDSINSALVLAKEGDGGEKELVAYYLSDEELEHSEIRGFLSDSLPDYMVPSHFIYLDSFPVTPNGKVDRGALPDPDRNREKYSEYVAPRNGTEEKLAEIWQEVLRIERIGIQDNFYKLGAHSLNVIKILSRIRREFEIDIKFNEIFQTPNIMILAELIDSYRCGLENTNQIDKEDNKRIEQVTRQNHYILSNAQRRLWILDQFEKESIAYNIPASFLLEGELNTNAFRQAFSYMLDRHESLRTVFIMEEGEPRQSILKNPDCDIDIIDLRDTVEPEKEARLLAEKDILTPFNLKTESLVRFSILQMENEKNLLLFNMHHIISDGWSMNIFIKEFLTCYNCFRAGRAIDMKPLAIQYKDYSVWQNNLLESSEIEIQKSYWLNKLSGELPVLDLPSDKVRPATQTFSGKSTHFTLSKEISSALNNLCQDNHVSLFMMLHALVKTLFHRYTGQEDILLGSPVAGRRHEDLENQIGFY
ncbi:MAG: amino acid adenylation domain-containing protein, partial [bacterium]|nr:amino acid adenylation domain-containing protein [bacterium]